LDAKNLCFIETKSFLDNTTFHQFNSLDLNQYQISLIEPKSFHSLDFIEELHLDRNEITNLEPHTFQGLKQLKILNLDENLISNIESNSFGGLDNLL
jgi:Leucine-rich repeat (LRR) protein